MVVDAGINGIADPSMKSLNDVAMQEGLAPIKFIVKEVSANEKQGPILVNTSKARSNILIGASFAELVKGINLSSTTGGSRAGLAGFQIWSGKDAHLAQGRFLLGGHHSCQQQLVCRRWGSEEGDEVARKEARGGDGGTSSRRWKDLGGRQ
ncbi:hypothetical protein L7F22_065250 [Adiantum nelumboides]|nr:hypothetical protein [Adiantum nelumboides]